MVAGNTVVSAYLELLKHGLRVYREPSAVTDSGMCWVAEDDSRQFIAEDTGSLLGLVAMHTSRGPEWRASDEEIERFLSEFGSV
jgi:hypothetical protein